MYRIYYIGNNKTKNNCDDCLYKYVDYVNHGQTNGRFCID